MRHSIQDGDATAVSPEDVSGSALSKMVYIKNARTCHYYFGTQLSQSANEAVI